MVERVEQGKTYTCEACHCELQAVKGPDTDCTCNLSCCGKPMKEKE